MAVSTSTLSSIVRGFQQRATYGNLTEFDEGCYVMAKQLLIQSLPPTERRVHEWMYEVWMVEAPAVTARDVANQFDMQINQASTVLKRLHDWGVIQRSPRVDDNGLIYEYR